MAVRLCPALAQADPTTCPLHLLGCLLVLHHPAFQRALHLRKEGMVALQTSIQAIQDIKETFEPLSLLQDLVLQVVLLRLLRPGSHLDMDVEQDIRLLYS